MPIISNTRNTNNAREILKKHEDMERIANLWANGIRNHNLLSNL